MAKKYKITRKQIKKEDKFVSALKDVTKKIVRTTITEKAETPWKKYIKIAAVVIGAVLVVFALVFGLLHLRNQKAERLMAQADAIYRAMVVTKEQYDGSPAFRAMGAYIDAKKKWSDAVEQYEAVIGKYPSTDYGILSLLYAANCYYELGEYEESIGKYEKYIQKAGAEAPFVLLARQSVGYAYEALQRYDEAEQSFLALTAEEGTTISVLSLFDLARIYETKKEYGKALDSLKKLETLEIASSPQYYQLKRQAEQKIKMLQSLAEQGSS